jgi:hypothetical protein
MTKQEVFAVLFVAALFVGMLVCLEIGLVLGRRSTADEGGKEGLSVIEGAIFALLGLLIAFTFSGAAARFEGRRHYIVEEANDIGTAYLRIDLLPADSQPEIRELFRRYVDSRIETYKVAGAHREKAMQLFIQSQNLQNEIWQKSVAAAGRSPNTAASMLLLPAVNAMIDITTTRLATTENHPPMIIFAMLALIALASSMMAGFEMATRKKRSWLHIAGYALILSISVYVILDLEFPRLGIIRVDAFDHYIVDVRNSMR